MKKLIIFLLLTLALALFCVSCANTNGEAPSDETASGSQSEPAESEEEFPSMYFGESGIELPIDFFD